MNSCTTVENAKIKYIQYNNRKNLNNSIYIPYIASDGSFKKYYPDFIISTEKRIYILDTKAKNSNSTFEYHDHWKIWGVSKQIDKKKIIDNSKEIKYGYIYKNNHSEFIFNDIILNTPKNNNNYNNDDNNYNNNEKMNMFL